MGKSQNPGAFLAVMKACSGRLLKWVKLLPVGCGKSQYLDFGKSHYQDFGKSQFLCDFVSNDMIG